MQISQVVSLFGVFATVTAHAATTGVTIDGIKYRGFDARVDLKYPNLESIEWSYNNSGFMGMAPVVDVKSKDMACRKASKPPALKAVARAGAEVTFSWTPYYQQHKGPIMTYMGRLESPDQSINTVKFFKIDEYGRVPGTAAKWASDKLIAQNYTWSSQIPSDIKPGLYVLRHELLALHDAARSYNGVSQSGAQFFPTCYSVEITGTGTAVPEGKTFPGMYATNDAGVKIDLYNPKASFIMPGLAKYNGKYDAPVGTPPVVNDTGKVPIAIKAKYNKDKAIAQFISVWTTEGADYYVPGAGETPSTTFKLSEIFPKLMKGLAEINGKPESAFLNMFDT